MDNRVDFVRLVRGLRHARGLTQEQLAHELGVTFGTVNGWENGRHRPLPLLARRLLELAGDSGLTIYRIPDDLHGRVADRGDGR